MNNYNPTRAIQEKIYRELYETHKGTPMAVSSESPNHKKLRYEKIASVTLEDVDFTLHDIGMGLSDFNQYLIENFPNKKIIYSGSDILPEFVMESNLRFPECQFFCRDIAERAFEDSYDYVIMSGLFHQRRETKIRDWEKFWQNVLGNAFRMSKKGIAFNFISPFVDFYQTQVYYVNLWKLINYINDDLSRFFSIQHDYALFELTVHVYHESYVKQKYSQPEFQKYFS